MNQAINIIPAIVTLDNNIGSQTTISIQNTSDQTQKCYIKSFNKQKLSIFPEQFSISSQKIQKLIIQTIQPFQQQSSDHIVLSVDNYNVNIPLKIVNNLSNLERINEEEDTSSRYQSQIFSAARHEQEVESHRDSLVQNYQNIIKQKNNTIQELQSNLVLKSTMSGNNKQFFQDLAQYIQNKELERVIDHVLTKEKEENEQKNLTILELFKKKDQEIQQKEAELLAKDQQLYNLQNNQGQTDLHSQRVESYDRKKYELLQEKQYNKLNNEFQQMKEQYQILLDDFDKKNNLQINLNSQNKIMQDTIKELQHSIKIQKNNKIEDNNQKQNQEIYNLQLQLNNSRKENHELEIMYKQLLLDAKNQQTYKTPYYQDQNCSQNYDFEKQRNSLDIEVQHLKNSEKIKVLRLEMLEKEKEQHLDRIKILEEQLENNQQKLVESEFKLQQDQNKTMSLQQEIKDLTQNYEQQLLEVKNKYLTTDKEYTKLVNRLQGNPDLDEVGIQIKQELQKEVKKIQKEFKISQEQLQQQLSDKEDIIKQLEKEKGSLKVELQDFYKGQKTKSQDKEKSSNKVKELETKNKQFTTENEQQVKKLKENQEDIEKLQKQIKEINGQTDSDHRNQSRIIKQLKERLEILDKDSQKLQEQKTFQREEYKIEMDKLEKRHFEEISQIKNECKQQEKKLFEEIKEKQQLMVEFQAKEKDLLIELNKSDINFQKLKRKLKIPEGDMEQILEHTTKVPDFDQNQKIQLLQSELQIANSKLKKYKNRVITMKEQQSTFNVVEQKYKEQIISIREKLAQSEEECVMMRQQSAVLIKEKNTMVETDQKIEQELSDLKSFMLQFQQERDTVLKEHQHKEEQIAQSENYTKQLLQYLQQMEINYKKLQQESFDELEKMNNHLKNFEQEKEDANDQLQKVLQTLRIKEQDADNLNLEYSKINRVYQENLVKLNIIEEEFTSYQQENKKYQQKNQDVDEKFRQNYSKLERTLKIVMEEMQEQNEQYEQAKDTSLMQQKLLKNKFVQDLNQLRDNIIANLKKDEKDKLAKAGPTAIKSPQKAKKMNGEQQKKLIQQIFETYAENAKISQGSDAQIKVLTEKINLMKIELKKKEQSQFIAQPLQEEIETKKQNKKQQNSTLTKNSKVPTEALFKTEVLKTEIQNVDQFCEDLTFEAQLRTLQVQYTNLQWENEKNKQKNLKLEEKLEEAYQNQNFIQDKKDDLQNKLEGLNQCLTEQTQRIKQIEEKSTQRERVSNLKEVSNKKEVLNKKAKKQIKTEEDDSIEEEEIEEESEEEICDVQLKSNKKKFLKDLIKGIREKKKLKKKQQKEEKQMLLEMRKKQGQDRGKGMMQQIIKFASQTDRQIKHEEPQEQEQQGFLGKVFQGLQTQNSQQSREQQLQQSRQQSSNLNRQQQSQINSSLSPPRRDNQPFVVRHVQYDQYESQIIKDNIISDHYVSSDSQIIRDLKEQLMKKREDIDNIKQQKLEREDENEKLQSLLKVSEEEKEKYKKLYKNQQRQEENFRDLRDKIEITKQNDIQLNNEKNNLLEKVKILKNDVQRKEVLINEYKNKMDKQEEELTHYRKNQMDLDEREKWIGSTKRLKAEIECKNIKIKTFKDKLDALTQEMEDKKLSIHENKKNNHKQAENNIQKIKKLIHLLRKFFQEQNIQLQKAKVNKNSASNTQKNSVVNTLNTQDNEKLTAQQIQYKDGIQILNIPPEEYEIFFNPHNKSANKSHTILHHQSNLNDQFEEELENFEHNSDINSLYKLLIQMIDERLKYRSLI